MNRNYLTGTEEMTTLHKPNTIDNKIIEYIDEKISDANSEIKEMLMEGLGNSHACGFEAGTAYALQELKDFIKELKENDN